MYKIIACDLDETLLNSDHKINQRTIKAIKQAQAAGIKFVPATGRGFTSVASTLQELDLLDAENEFVISFNGGAITENKNNRLLHFEGITFEKASTLFKRGLNYNVGIRVYTKDNVYAYNYTDEERKYSSARMQITEIAEADIDFLNGQEIVKILYINTDYNYLKSIENDLRDIVEDMNVTYSSNRYIEFNHSGVDKGTGLITLAKLLNVDMQDTIAIGDNYNDLSMIQCAGLGVYVANAVEELKPYADYVTTATNNEDAVAEVIEKFILNK